MEAFKFIITFVLLATAVIAAPTEPKTPEQSAVSAPENGEKVVEPVRTKKYAPYPYYGSYSYGYPVASYAPAAASYYHAPAVTSTVYHAPAASVYHAPVASVYHAPVASYYHAPVASYYHAPVASTVVHSAPAPVSHVSSSKTYYPTAYNKYWYGAPAAVTHTSSTSQVHHYSNPWY